MPVLAAAPWGAPFVWEPASYSLADCKVVTARTSLEAVVDCFKAERALVVVADSLATVPERDCKAAGGPIDLESIGSYSELVNAVRAGVEAWIRSCSGGRHLPSMLDEGKLSVEVVPGLGTYGGWRFGPQGTQAKRPSPIESYGGEVLLLLLDSLLEVRPEKLVVDLTHGVNYMPVAFYEASRLAALAYSASQNKAIELVYTNSEPYPKSGAGPREPAISIHMVGREVIEPDRAAEEIALLLKHHASSLKGEARAKPLRLAPGYMEPDLGIKIRVVEEEITPMLRAGIAATHITLYSMPLAALYLAASILKDGPGRLQVLVEKLASTRRLRDEETRIDSTEKKIVPSILYSMRDIVLLAFSAALQDYLGRVVGEIPERHQLEEEGAPLTKLEEIAERLSPTYRPIALNELDKMAKNCLNPRGECPLPLLLYRWPNEKCDQRAVSSMDPRNLRAHAGLERNITEAKIGCSDLYLRYRKGCWDKLYEQLSKPSF
ncbi:MAG: CRISPR-associated CARF protein Csx1 [Pyrodictiaceae archaeon]